MAPLISTPMAITASKGWLDDPTVECGSPGVPEREAGLVVLSEGNEPPKLSPRRSPALEPPCTCDPAMTLQYNLEPSIEF